MDTSEPTIEELQEQIEQLRLENHELRTGGKVVASLLDQLRKQYTPAPSIADSDRQWTTDDIVRNMAAIIPGIDHVSVANGMVHLGFMFDQVEGQWYWLLRSVRA